MYELIVLSLLMRGPFHGYLIVKVANDIIGPWAKISSGTLYPLLGKMERAGLITTLTGESEKEVAQKERQARTLVITEEGRKRFRQIMMDMSSNLGDYVRIFQYKVVFMDLIEHEERLLLFHHFMNYCATSILHLQTERANLAHELSKQSDARFLANAALVMEHFEAQMQHELHWARELHAQELARVESLPPKRALAGNDETKPGAQ